MNLFESINGKEAIIITSFCNCLMLFLLLSINSIDPICNLNKSIFSSYIYLLILLIFVIFTLKLNFDFIRSFYMGDKQ